MIVQLRTTTSNLIATFMDHKTFVYNYGYKNYNSCYACNTINTLNFKATNFAGFWDNLKPNPETDKGVGEIGSVWRGSSFDERLITWNFTPIINNSPNSISPQSYLNAMINTNEVVEVIVDNNFKGYFYFLNDTTTEGGVISMATTDVNNGVFWSGGTTTKSWYFLETNPYIPKTLPQVLLNPDIYPLVIEIFSEARQVPKIKIGGKLHGIWESFNFETSEQTLFYDNTINQDDYIIINSVDLTIINENGIDRSGEVTLLEGTSKFPLINVNFNHWEVYLNGTTNFEELTNIPTDMRVEVTYEELFSAIPIEVMC